MTAREKHWGRGIGKIICREFVIYKQEIDLALVFHSVKDNIA